MAHSLSGLCKRAGLVFGDPALLTAALTHRSAGFPHNERLEFLGDAVLGFLIAEVLYNRFHSANEGILSRLRADLVNQQSLAGLARKLGLGDHLILGPGELKSGGFRRDSILSDAYEALIAAVLLDQGIDVCRSWVITQFQPLIDGLSAEHIEKDPKTRLQEYLQARDAPLPTYLLIAQDGPAHAQLFSVECKVHLSSLWIATQGEGGSRKRAEQQAAERMLSRLTTGQEEPL